jgi:hypothetical protein
LSIAYGFYPLGLGPTNPTRIHLPSETLGLRRTRFSRAFTLLIPAFALEFAPESLTAFLLRPSTLPYPWTNSDFRQASPSHGFGGRLEPRWIVGAGSLDQ